MSSLKPASKPSLEEFNQPLELLTEHQLKGYIAAVKQRREDLEWVLDNANNKALRNNGEFDTRVNIQQTTDTWLKMMQFEAELQTRLAQREAETQSPNASKSVSTRQHR